MPSTSPKQHRLMEAIDHGWKKPGGGGPSKGVAHEFVEADKATHAYAGGGAVKSEGTRFCGPVMGWRCWNLESNGLLRSVYQNTVWVPGLPMTGRVANAGIYAFKTKGQAVALLGDLIGCVACLAE